jgi:hypothetical protein
MEKLYDDTVEERMKGAALILQLAREPGNLETILFNGVYLVTPIVPR